MKNNILFYIKNFIFLIIAIFCLCGACALDDIGGKIFFGILTLVFSFFSSDLFIVLLSKKKNIINEKNKELESFNKEKEILISQLENLRNEINKYLIKKNDIILEINNLKNEKNTSIDYVDALEGLEFEEYVYNLLKKLGYKNVSKTPATGDFGIDILAEKDNIKYAIQCKNYNNILSNKCVQEAFSGKQYYNCHVGVVVTNNYFTNHAIQLANKNGILLWNRDKLIELIELSKGNNNKRENEDDIDEFLYTKIVDFAIKSGKISAPILQSEFRLKYNEAAKMINLLEKRRIIGSPNGSKPREVLVRNSKATEKII